MSRFDSMRAWLIAAAMLIPLAPAAGATPVAVFNFQMKSDTPDWKWLEKGLSDRIATDFVQDRTLSVVARDEMQLLAQKMNWVPEMATTDPQRMKELQSQLKIEYLATGVYSVSGDEIAIIGQIVEVKGRAELFRKEVKGKAAEVLELQRRLSADLLSWFSKKPAAQILATLPVWTRSLPAAKALYEGMDLYDQGRYAEGWLRFRQASRTDPSYMEAQYFVGKMYYFMQRYEHARRSIERFVYLDTVHPRVGDAMVEYVHTYENSDAPAESLLQLYEDLGKRYPDALVWEGWTWGKRGFLENVDWLKFKTAQLLGQLGRHKEAALMTRPAMREAGGFFSKLDGAFKCYCILNVLEHHARTGGTFEPDVLIDTKLERERRQLLQFEKKGAAVEWQFPSPTRIQGSASGSPDKTAPFDSEKAETVLLLVAPAGHVFTSLAFYPLADGNDAAMEVALFVLGTPTRAGCPRFAPQRTETVAAARERGIVWDNVPSSGLLQARCIFRAKDMFSQPVVVRGLRVVPRLTPRPAPGAIDVSCTDTPNFRVDVDGIFARWLPGLVGPLAPGEHAVRLAPLEPGAPYEPWETRVTVESGKVTRLLGRLPWKSGTPWSSWRTLCIGEDYPGYDLRLRNPIDAPAIQADEGAIRLIWTHGGDLWSSASTDGENFSAPAKLALPVSSGWSEERPRLLRDESGRFILTFLSDREARHLYLPYLSWSRDFIHWTAPALVSGKSVTDYDILQDDRGRFILAQMLERTVGFLSSRDGFRWQPLGSVDVAEQGWRGNLVKLIRREDGALELFVTEYASAGSIPDIEKRDVGGRVLCRVSNDGATWSKPEIIAQCHWYANPTGFACGRADGHTFVLWSRCDPLYLHSRLALYARKSEGRWDQAGCAPTLPPAGKISAAFHPAWGYLIASMTPDGTEVFPYPCRGPYLMRGPILDPLRAGAPDTRLAREAPSLPSQDKIGRGSTLDATGRVLNVSLRNKAVEEWFRFFQPRPAPSTGAGDLSSLPYLWCMPHRVPGGSMYFDVRDRAAFKTPAQSSGTVNGKAVMLKLERDALRMAVALDSKTPETPTYDVLRLDATGQGNFENAVEVPWLFMGSDPPPNQSFRYTFVHPCVSLKDGNRILQAALKAEFEERRGQQTFRMNLFTCSVGKCAIGAKTHDVFLIDSDGNLRVDGVFRVTSLAGREHVLGSGDVIVVDLPKTKPPRPFWGTSEERHVTWGYYGHPLLVDGALYEVTVSEDGARISAKPFQGKTGLIRVDHPIWEAEIANETRVIVLNGGTAPVPVPVGRYRVLQYWEWSPEGGQGADVQPLHLWRPESAVGREFWIEVREGQTLETPIGSPLRGKLAVQQEGRTLRFSIKIADAGGWQEVNTQDSHQECTIVIRDVSGQPVKTLRCTLIHSRAEWSVPPELGGTFSASVEVEPGRFPVKVQELHFSVK